MHAPKLQRWLKARWYARIDKHLHGVHPSAYGHTFLAQLLCNLVREEVTQFYEDSNRWAQYWSATRQLSGLPAPAFLSAAATRRFVEPTIVLDLDCTADDVLSRVSGNGWAKEEDVPGRPGLITRDRDAVLKVPFSVPESNLEVMVIIGLLKSYKHTSDFSASVVDQVTGKTVVDVQIGGPWQHKLSVYEEAHLKFITTATLKTYPVSYMLLVQPNFTRKHVNHMVKLLSVQVTSSTVGTVV